MTKSQDPNELKNYLTQAWDYFVPPHLLIFKSMFGGICAYVDGRVFSSLSNMGLALKLKNEDQQALLKEDGAKYLQYDPSQPVSKQYVVVPDKIVCSPEMLSYWLQLSVEHVLTLPQKVKPKK